ncbi:MAG: radical SAM protein [Gammaproteobacteria bacterium]|jgi:sulfatase maturation enzyme AslB (radical SAM superfamily)
MANVLLTTRCNLSCDYCFAKEKMSGMPRQRMTVDDAAKVIDFLKRSDFGQFRVMGGEPTLHPQFVDIVSLALRAEMRVDVLSNATWREDCADFFRRVPPARLYFLLNIDHPANYHPKQWTRIRRNLEALPDRRNVTLSFNIFEKRPEYQYIFDLTTQYDISMVRLSFSLPVLGVQNACLDIADYKAMAPFIMDFVRQAENCGVQIQIDNAIPLCIFSHEQIGRLVLDGVLDLQRNARCEPVIDIAPDLTVWCCFCLSKLQNRKLDEFDDLQHLREYYRRMIRRLQNEFVPMDECVDCRYRDLWNCQGGCITYAIRNHEDSAVDTCLADEQVAFLDDGAVVALAEDVDVQRYDIPSECYVLVRRASGLEIELQNSVFERLVALLDGEHTVRDIRANCFSSGNGQTDRETAADNFARQIELESADQLLAGLMRQGFLVERSAY